MSDKSRSFCGNLTEKLGDNPLWDIISSEFVLQSKLLKTRSKTPVPTDDTGAETFLCQMI